jgi:hypothetical protein
MADATPIPDETEVRAKWGAFVLSKSLPLEGETA